ncbi:hypothetical protein PUN28_011382 [Cardiocondyla obscurior]|uniref:Uncharacterized protein n=1 Tax=Cardiocondyla obscurior TaxID=286306 RepID=A0AAW2FG38_9HYME
MSRIRNDREQVRELFGRCKERRHPLSKSVDDGKRWRIERRKLGGDDDGGGGGGGGVATRCCLERRIAKSLEHRTATTLHMATPREDQYPHQSYFSLNYGTLSLCGRAI